MWFLLMAVKLNMTPSLTFMPIKVKIACVFLVRENLINSQSIQIYLYWLIMSQRKAKSLLKRKYQKRFKNFYVATSHFNAKQELSDYYYSYIL